MRILFIGNSYTFINDLPGTFANLACSGGHKVETGMVAPGGAFLSDHVTSQETQTALKDQKWDIVILQEQSMLPASTAYRGQSMYPAVRTLNAQIKTNGAKPYLFLTWGHREGWPDGQLTNYQDMQNQLNQGYYGIAQELGIPVIPVGLAWQKAVQQPKPLDLWQSDGSHPNPNGTYLAASVFYATIFQQTPLGLGYWAGLSQETAQALQTLAAETVPVKK